MVSLVLDQVQGQSSVGVTNTTFLGNVNANSQGGGLAVAPGGLVQVSLQVSAVQSTLHNSWCTNNLKGRKSFHGSFSSC